ncbi:MAG TPA: phosphate regulon sensor histidine kinase PhoR [Usitatibacter sp.]|nr:phosphate regulon sensor histidine kinase PhoR [Usitatibacter sp.]
MLPSRIGAGILGSAMLVVGGALVALVVGYAADREWGWITLAIALAAALGWHLGQALRLGLWMERGGEPPRLIGLWDEMLGLVARLRREGERREVELAEALTRWREAGRALPDGVTLLDSDRVEWCNDTARTHLGIDPDRDGGRPLTHLVRAPELARYLADGDFSRPLEMRPPDGRVLSLQAVDYGPSLRLVLSRDVTRFENVERMRREFVSNVSHELRTPLTVITGFLENLRADTPEADPGRRSLDLMDDQARRMLRLVEDLLTLSALESAPPPPIEEKVEMAAVLERLAAEARALSAGRHHVEVEGHPALCLMGSEKEISSALGNLVSNAVRYTPAGGSIRLVWRELPDGGEFAVEDTGIGIAPEHLPRLTERFYRVDRGRSRESGGTGLGLAIVKHALQRHGATLHIASEPGRGSRFAARFTGPRIRR